MSDVKNICPLMGCECLENGRGVKVGENIETHRCRFWVQVEGKDNNDQVIKVWDCSFALTPVLTVQNSKVQMGVQAAVESFRNEVVKGSTGMLTLLGMGSAAMGRLPPGQARQLLEEQGQQESSSFPPLPYNG